MIGINERRAPNRFRISGAHFEHGGNRAQSVAAGVAFTPGHRSAAPFDGRLGGSRRGTPRDHAIGLPDPQCGVLGRIRHDRRIARLERSDHRQTCRKARDEHGHRLEQRPHVAAQGAVVAGLEVGADQCPHQPWKVGTAAPLGALRRHAGSIEQVLKLVPEASSAAMAALCLAHTAMGGQRETPPPTHPDARLVTA